MNELLDRAIDPPGGSETILIVEDERALLKVAVSYLKDLGYRTLTASGGKQALEVLKEHQDIELLFCDVIMPGDLDGFQVALEAHERYPSLQVLMTSGFTERHEKYSIGGYLSGLASNLLAKPYNLEELARAVRRTLDREA